MWEGAARPVRSIHWPRRTRRLWEKKDFASPKTQPPPPPTPRPPHSYRQRLGCGGRALAAAARKHFPKAAAPRVFASLVLMLGQAAFVARARFSRAALSHLCLKVQVPFGPRCQRQPHGRHQQRKRIWQLEILKVARASFRFRQIRLRKLGAGRGAGPFKDAPNGVGHFSAKDGLVRRRARSPRGQQTQAGPSDITSRAEGAAASPHSKPPDGRWLPQNQWS